MTKLVQRNKRTYNECRAFVAFSFSFSFVLAASVAMRGASGFRSSVAYRTCVHRQVLPTSSGNILVQPFRKTPTKYFRAPSIGACRFRSVIQSTSSANEQHTPLNEIDPGVVEGTDLKILKYPHPALRAENSEITQEELTSGKIGKLAKEMFLIMYASEGVGLAAPQVGVNKRLMVYNPTGDPKKWLDETTLVNPKIVEYGEGKDIETEGCLSFPDMNGDVERSKVIKVEAINIKGKKIRKKFKGWEARIFQHEYDHLDGIVYIDRLTEEGRQGVQPRLNELIADFGDGGTI